MSSTFVLAPPPPPYVLHKHEIMPRLAKTGKEWADIFTNFNSGTYNNQWMIIDYNQFDPSKDKLEVLSIFLFYGISLFEHNDLFL